MGLKERINQDLIQSLKNKDSLRVDTLRFLNSSIHNFEIEKRGKSGGGKVELTDDDILNVLFSEAKKRKEAMGIYGQGGRPELAEKEKKELEIIGVYLPAQASEEEIMRVIEEAVAKTGVQSPADFGRVMAEVMKPLKGRVDGSRISELIKKRLGKTG